jgi:hypothetical protein
MNCGLTRDQDFRQFKRKVKIKNKYEENIKKAQTNNDNDINNNNDNDNSDIKEKKNNIYIPMNFNLIFNYFINKEKQRNSFLIVENAIKEMDKIIQGEDEYDNNIEINNPKKKKRESIKVLAYAKSLNEKNTKKLKFRRFENKKLSEKKLYKYYNPKSSDKFNSKYYDIININKDINEEKLDINFSDLMKEFSNIFDIKDTDSKNEGKESSEEKNRIQSSNSAKSLLFKQCNKKDNTDKKEKIFINTMNNDNNNNNNEINSSKKLSINNFEKYHNLKMAINETKEKIKKNKNLRILNDDELKIHNLLDIKDIIKKGNSIISPKESQFKRPIINENLENSSYRENNSIKSNNFYIKTLKVENDVNSGIKKIQLNKKPLYNFYCGMPKIINLENNYIPKLLQKYDYVPNEFFNSKK